MLSADTVVENLQGWVSGKFKPQATHPSPQEVPDRLPCPPENSERDSVIPVLTAWSQRALIANNPAG